MKLRHLAFTILAILSVGRLAWAADVPGSKDPPSLKRFQGSEIVYYVTHPFDRYLLALADPTPNAPANGWKFNEIEGQITRVFYQEPPGHSILELMRNYEQALKEAGFSQTFELSHGINDQANFAGQFYAQGKQADADAFHWSSFKDCGYLTAKGSKDGQDITVAVYFHQYNATYGPINFPGVAKPPQFAADQVAVVVDYITAKALENNMVEVKAEDMADALATKGFVDIYGINFDVDKTDVKPESKKALDQVASLLKIDRSLKLEVSGHTDSTGDKAHNMQLSEGRAKAVVDALVKQYGIDAARLTAKGYGDTKPVASNDTDDGRAKNRRVELTKL